MAGQGPSRRELLQALSLAGVASTFRGFSRWSYALGEETTPHHHQDAPVKIAGSYNPQFFPPKEYRTVEVLADLILPATVDTSHQPQPGAKEAGVAEFIDFMVYNDPSLQARFQDGLAWLDNASKPAAGFTALSADQQNALLERLAYKAKHRANEKAGQQLFVLFRKYTVMGFYTSRIGLESLDYPGLKLYSESPGCAHQGNPEHVGL
jgi:gluconate 2-dehydrogenase gamma chain